MSEEQSATEIQTGHGDNCIIDGRKVLVLILQTLRFMAILCPNQKVSHKSSLYITVRMPGDVIITEITAGSGMNLASLFHSPGDELLKHMMWFYLYTTVKIPESLPLATTMDMKTKRVFRLCGILCYWNHVKNHILESIWVYQKCGHLLQFQVGCYI